MFTYAVPIPLPLEERPGSHCLRMCEIFVIFSVKSFVRKRKIILTKNRAFFEIDSSDDFTCRTLLGHYFSDVAVSFFQTYSATER